MSKTFDRAPVLPKMRRRIGRDTTELLVTTLALICSASVFGVMIRQPEFFDITKPGEYEFMKDVLMITSLCLWFFVIRLELTAKNKAETMYGHQMKEYKIMRIKWLEIASQKMDYEAKKAIQPVEIVKENPVAKKAKKVEEEKAAKVAKVAEKAANKAEKEASKKAEKEAAAKRAEKEAATKAAEKAAKKAEKEAAAEVEEEIAAEKAAKKSVKEAAVKRAEKEAAYEVEEEKTAEKP